MVAPTFTSWNNLHQPPKPVFPRNPNPNAVPVPNPSATNQPFKSGQFKPISFSFNLGSTSNPKSKFNPPPTYNAPPPSDPSPTSTSITSASSNLTSTSLSTILDRIKQGAPLPPRAAPPVHPWRRMHVDLTNSQTRTDLSQAFNIVRTIPFDDILFPPTPIDNNNNTTNKGDQLELNVDQEVREYDPSQPYFSPFKSSAKSDTPPHQMTPLSLRQVIVPDPEPTSAPAPVRLSAPARSEIQGKKKASNLSAVSTKKKSKITTHTNKSSHIHLSKKLEMKKTQLKLIGKKKSPHNAPAPAMDSDLHVHDPILMKIPTAQLRDQRKAAQRRGLSLEAYLKRKEGQNKGGITPGERVSVSLKDRIGNGNGSGLFSHNQNIPKSEESKLDVFIKLIKGDPEIQDIFTHHTTATTAALENNAKFRLYKRLGEIVDRF
ncbi:hypothetical protein I302_105149 [Kwoniella bestiolae CBS 10118]|uniref:Uncharacterized protein n=1 Tax=Kwoniella bestiolae CBS 10118 TaxID=1296100 RepID=A0AAJ8K8E8_9TREE